MPVCATKTPFEPLDSLSQMPAETAFSLSLPSYQHAILVQHA